MASGWYSAWDMVVVTGKDEPTEGEQGQRFTQLGKD